MVSAAENGAEGVGVAACCDVAVDWVGYCGVR